LASDHPGRSTLPLAGIRVLDCSRVLAGPFATMYLADLGADVIKVEPPGGDETRAWGPPFWGDPADAPSAYFAAVNRNKRSVVVDLKSPAGRDVLDRLIAGRDLLVHNARPDTAQRLGLGAERLASRHPDLVTAAVGGSGAVGSMELAHGGAWLDTVDGMRLAPNPIRVDGRRVPVELPPPLLGEHTVVVLAEIGLEEEAIARLMTAGVVDGPARTPVAAAPTQH
jgi:crotonobetainyl-CoA:carnitine CoA-transferase CaiB-like acyl-CoA transferase